jgi:hypothetical protein
MDKSKALTLRPLSRQSRPVEFRDRLIRLVDVDGETWVCKTDAANAIGATFKIDDRDWASGDILMANIRGGYDIMAHSNGGETSMLCVSLKFAKSLSAGSMAPSEDVRALWDWIDQQSPTWEGVAARELKRRKMALFNEFHHVRRFANSIEFGRARRHALSWIDLLNEIDECTTLEERFELCGTNIADRDEMIELAKKYGARLTMHVILSVMKGGHTATYRSRSGFGWSGERFGMYLSWFTAMDRKDLNPMAQFFDLKDAFPEAKRSTPSELVAQFDDLIAKRRHLVELSRENQQQGAEMGLSNVAVLYGAAASLHAHILSMWREAAADGSLEAIESAIAEAVPFCCEAAETEREIVKILKSGGDAAPRILH